MIELNVDWYFRMIGLTGWIAAFYLLYRYIRTLDKVDVFISFIICWDNNAKKKKPFLSMLVDKKKQLGNDNNHISSFG